MDDIIIFHGLNKELLKQIVDIQINRMRKYLKDRHVDLELSDRTKAHLAEIGYDPLYGARPLKRTIQREILNPLASKILEGSFKTGDIITVDIDDGNVVFSKKKTDSKEQAAAN